MGANGDGAKKLGERLLAEVEVEDLSSVLKTLRELRVSRHQQSESAKTTKRTNFFAIPELDAFFASPSPPVLELICPPAPHHLSGAGRTSLLYLIIAHAILPSTISPSILLNGQSSAVILFDPLQHFTIPRLVQVMLRVITTALTSSNNAIDEAMKLQIQHLISQSLLHLHIFRPQSWDSFLATLRNLPEYLFDRTKHRSIHRRVHSIVLDDIDAFAWSIRNKSASTMNPRNPLTTASTLLTSTLNRLSTRLSCAIITTSGAASSDSWRSVMPVSWPQNVHVTRLAVRRVEVLKFAPASSVEEAEAERAQRWDVVKKGRFECWKIGGGGEGMGFVFRVGKDGVEREREKEKDVA